jgi:PAS domain S-box-containing protein
MRMAKAASPRPAVAAVRSLADILLDPRSGGDAIAALDHLRRDLRADDAFLWRCDEIRATCALHSGGSDIPDSLSVGFEQETELAARLRASGTVLCHAGELSGLEQLVPSACGSYAAAAATRRDGVTAVLVMAWPEAQPPCDDRDVRDLRIAAALLGNTLPDSAVGEMQAGLSATVAASVAGRLAVTDRNGIIVAVNAAWTKFATRQGVTPESLGIGENYVEVHRRAMSAGSAEADAVKAGIESVCNGSSDSYSTTYSCDLPGEERWWMVMVTPLRHEAGGAVIEHLALTHSTIDDLAGRLGNLRFERLADTAPVPVWIAAADGRLLYANEQWEFESRAGVADRERVWTEPIHPDDRQRASAIFELAASRRRPFHAELRIKSSDGSYRWWSCRAAPRYDTSGELECYVGVCADAMATRTWKLAFDQVAGKLVASQEAERIRIARELHDDLGQQTAVLASKLDILAQTRTVSQRMRSGLSEIRTRVQEIATSIHALSHQLHPAKLRLLGLVRTLEALCRDESIGSGVTVRFESTHVPRHLAEDITLCLFRVAQEGIRNALKHSGATIIDVSLTATAAQIVLQVSDNGAGFNPLVRSAGLGLLTMRERVLLVRGVLSVHPSQPGGTTVKIVVPLVPEQGVRPQPELPGAAAPLRAAARVPVARRASAVQDPELIG